jgi:hypothetical protein
MFSLYIVKMMTFTSGMVFFKNGGYFCSVHLRHSKIKQDQIWTQQLGFLNGLGAVRRLTADLHVAPGPEKHVLLHRRGFVLPLGNAGLRHQLEDAERPMQPIFLNRPTGVEVLRRNQLHDGGN